MLLSILPVLAITFSGFAITYLISDDEKLMWRIAAGNVIGSAVFGTLLFAAAMLGGLSGATIAATLLVSLVPIAMFLDARNKRLLKVDWQRAAANLNGADFAKVLSFAFYAFFIVLFVMFFRRDMVETPQGIFTGGSQNLGDLPFHLGAILGFSDGANFPPQNPSFAGAKFSYPFIADLLTAAFVKIGARVSDAMFVQHVSWAFSLLVILENFIAKLTGDRVAGRIGPALLFFSGGLGFLTFFSDFWAQAKPLTDFIWSIPNDYTIGEKFRWGNSLVVMFMTQRSLLLGMPLALISLGVLWRAFADETVSETLGTTSLRGIVSSAFVAGVLAGLLPLVHLHSLAVLFVVGIFVLVLQPRKYTIWLAFATGVAVVAVPELIWSLAGSASETSKFVGWHYGWNKADDESIVWFWLANTGIFIPMLAAGIYLLYRKEAAGPTDAPVRSKFSPDRLLMFYLPFAFLFFVSNVAKLAPWEWDNIKVLVYWFVASIPFAAFALAWLWRRGSSWKAVAAFCFVVLTLSGALDVWRTVSGQINYKVFDRDAVSVAEKLKAVAAPNALFLNAPTYNTAVVLTGRRSVMRYVGHLSSHGIDYAERESDVKRIYMGGPDAATLLAKYGVDYVLVSPEERGTLNVNETFFAKFPVVAEAGQYKVYKIR